MLDNQTKCILILPPLAVILSQTYIKSFLTKGPIHSLIVFTSHTSVTTTIKLYNCENSETRGKSFWFWWNLFMATVTTWGVLQILLSARTVPRMEGPILFRASIDHSTPFTPKTSDFRFNCTFPAFKWLTNELFWILLPAIWNVFKTNQNRTYNGTFKGGSFRQACVVS